MCFFTVLEVGNPRSRWLQGWMPVNTFSPDCRWPPSKSIITGCYCSVSKSCPTLCDLMGWSMPGFPVLHLLSEFIQTHVHWVGDGPFNHSSSVIPFSSCPQSFPTSECFPMSQLFTSGGQNIGASASASVPQINIEGWFPLGLTGWISLQSKGLSRVFCSTTVQKHQFFSVQPHRVLPPSKHERVGSFF